MMSLITFSLFLLPGTETRRLNVVFLSPSFSLEPFQNFSFSTWTLGRKLLCHDRSKVVRMFDQSFGTFLQKRPLFLDAVKLQKVTTLSLTGSWGITRSSKPEKEENRDERNSEFFVDNFIGAISLVRTTEVQVKGVRTLVAQAPLLNPNLGLPMAKLCLGM